MIDFFSTYVPPLTDINEELTLDARQRLASYAAVGWPDLESSPNSVLGDLVVTPQAYMLAGQETGMDHFMSDLDLQNVANGIVYNCDFVTQYIKNFGVIPSEGHKGSGVSRLVFTENKKYVLDRGTQFSFGGTGIFSLYLPYLGPFTLFPVGSTIPVNENGTVLVDSGTNGAFYADVPLVGNMPAVVTAGASGMINVSIPELGAISALATFYPGEYVETLPALAEKTRSTMYSCSLNNRNGAIRFLRESCAFLEDVYVVLRGDSEMVRDMLNPYGVGMGYMDIYASSKNYAFTDSQTVRLFDASGDLTSFEGEFPYTGQIYFIESLYCSAVEVPRSSYHLYSESSNPQRVFRGTAAYSPYETLFLTVPNMKDPVTGKSMFTIGTSPSGQNYIDVSVTFRSDPFLRYINDTVNSPDNVPVNTDCLVRLFVPVVIDSMTVVYSRKSGVVPALDVARKIILDYFQALSAPEVYSDAPIIDAMGQAGVSYVFDIKVQAHVQWSVADRFGLPNEFTEVPTAPQILASKDLRVKYPANGAVAPANMCAAGTKNIKYILDDKNLHFQEEKAL